MKKIVFLSALLLMACGAFAQQTLYRYYNQKLSKHYYTVDFNEYGSGRRGWYLEGPACMVFDHEDRDMGIVPLLRYFNDRVGDHYYTANFDELRRGANGYVLEGKACFIAKFKGMRMVPLFGYFNRINGDPFLTTNRDEVLHGFDGYEFTGITGYVLPIGDRGDHDRGRGDHYRGGDRH